MRIIRFLETPQEQTGTKDSWWLVNEAAEMLKLHGEWNYRVVEADNNDKVRQEAV